MIAVLVSGGQTGADRAALDVALRHGFPYDGWCPAGRRAEDGPLDPRYALRETPSANYLQRTEWNVRDSDATVVFTPGRATGGSRRTIAFASTLLKPCLHITRASEHPELDLRRFVEEHRVRRLNVAGSRESTSAGTYVWVAQILETVLFGFLVPAIDRLEAQRIATEVILARGLGSGAKRPFLLAENPSIRLNIYNAPDLAECWIVYAIRPVRGLFSSNVVLLSRATGVVLFAGSAGDEG